ncbi:MAG: ABC transporter permease, partial [Anaerolineae bacterium]|nr:ABC transporter permease [Anaerolineae bacterium]
AAYTFTMAGTWTLVMKGSAVSVLGEDYVMAARARGLKERRIVTAYVGRNAVLPLVTRLAVVIANMLGSAPFIDTTLTYPGLGSLFDSAVKHGDFVLMQGIFFVIAAAVVLANLGTDILYSTLDPRIRLEG